MALSPSDRSITNPAGANQLLRGNSSSDRPTLGPRGNKVQAGALDLINATSPLGTPNKANPAGAQRN